MKEQMFGESFVPEKENAERLRLTLKRLKEYEHFLGSDLVSHLIEEDYEFDQEKQEEMQDRVKKFRNSISEDFKTNNDLKVKEDNHLSHILGNSILTSADGFARKFEDGKYSIGSNRYFIKNEKGEMSPLEFLSHEDHDKIKEQIDSGSRFIQNKNNLDHWILQERFDEKNKRRKFPEFPKNTAENMTKEIGLLDYYIQETARDPIMARKELSSAHGLLEDYLKYLKCDLPSQSTRRIELIKFFRDIEKGEINQDNLEEKSKNLQDLLDIEIIKQKWNI